MYTEQELQLLEEFSIHKSPKNGKCKKSPFKNGNHRVGTIPLESVLDGGLPGDSAQKICLHCGKGFDTCFIPKNQPSTLS